VPKLAPFRTEPTFSGRIWGAHSLAPLFPDKTDLVDPIGEAWLTDVNCRVINGTFAGRTLGEAWHEMPQDWRGTRLTSYKNFPLLVKFIFPNDKLSIQVHPDDAYAAQHEQAAGGRGKTEMWHVISAQPDAELFLGLKPGVTKETFRQAIHSDKVEDLFQRHPVRAGDTYFVPAGTQHAIGPGMIIGEIQEYSDLTYRVYDYKRVDASGKSRELHIEKALEVTNFEGTKGGKLSPLQLDSREAKKRLLAACDFFATERWDCVKETVVASDPGEFQLLVILRGSGKMLGEDVAFDYADGECWFVPASLPAVVLQPMRHTSFLRVTVPDRAELHQRLVQRGFAEEQVARVVMD
jgi:mannose-6-phosphate isomerase